tara:strand:- start:20472 stop:21008 length:537 start_codon:yes stop_codon:yes gene_type:complete
MKKFAEIFKGKVCTIVNSKSKPIRDATIELVDITDVTIVVTEGMLYSDGAFSNAIAQTESIEKLVNEKHGQLLEIRQNKLAAAVGTTVRNLANHEAHLARLNITAMDMLRDPKAWVDTKVGGVIHKSQKNIISAATAIIDTHRTVNAKIEVIISEFSVRTRALAAAKTIDQVNKVTWL